MIITGTNGNYIDVEILPSGNYSLRFYGRSVHPYSIELTDNDASSLALVLNKATNQGSQICKINASKGHLEKLKTIKSDLLQIYQETDEVEDELDTATDELIDAIAILERKYG